MTQARSTPLLFLAVAALWGAPYALIKVAVGDLPPVTVGSVRLAIGALALLPLALRSGGFPEVWVRGRWLVWLVVAELALPFTLIPAGETVLPSSVTGVLVSAAPLFVALLTLGIAEERGGPLRLIGVAIGFAGVGLLLGFDVPSGREGALAAAAILLACLGYATSGLVLRYRFAGTRPEAVMCAAMALAFALTAVPATIAAAHRATPTPDAMLALLALGIGPTGLAFWGFAELTARVGPARASIVAYVAPVFAVALGVTFLNEPVRPAMLAGLVTIVVGSRLATRRA